jgi:cytidine deaminase
MGTIAELFDAAAKARAKAHAPYSRFSVGAAILDGDGRVHAGANIENAAYPQGNCAEASAIAAMVTAGGSRKIIDIAVVGGQEGKAEILCPPCGGCRQRIREFGGLTARIHLRRPDGTIMTRTIDELLPFSFGPEHL